MSSARPFSVSRLLPARPGLRVMLLSLNALVAAALLWLSVQGWHASQSQQQAQARQVKLAEALHLSKQADMLHDALHADVLGALLVGQVPALQRPEIEQRARDNSAALMAALRELSRFELPGALAEQVARNFGLTERYAGQATQLVLLVGDDRKAGLAALAAFEQQFKLVMHALDEQGTALGQALRAAEADAARQADASRSSLLWICGLTIALASAFVALITTAIQRRLRELGAVAQAIADGDLERRAGDQGRDELGDLGRAIDQMAAGLNRMIASMREEAGRATFGKQLGEALDMADREVQVNQVVARAMAGIADDHAMELLISDSSQAHLERAAEHPQAGAPGCRVGSPYDCVAVRRGNMVSFEHSEALNACAHLRGRDGGAASAVCVPVTFMGRAIGVLHATGTPQAPLGTEQAQRLVTLGTQIGMRIGTVRAFEKTQLQAATDGLTGLPNRRNLEQQMRQIALGDKPFSVVMCDLDRFKMLNDTHGHAAGDSALRTFAEVLRQSLRDQDRVGRWGGEEFAFVLVGAAAANAEEMINRLRKRLSQTQQMGKGPRFTASFGIADSTMSRRPEDLVRLADVALYQAKAQGRDRACVADPSAAPEHVREAENFGAGIDHAATLAEA